MREVKPHCEPKSSYVSLWPKLTKLYQSEATYFPTQLIFIFNIAQFSQGKRCAFKKNNHNLNRTGYFCRKK